MTYREPRVRILDISSNGELYRISVGFEDPPSRPFAPASLCRDDNPASTLVALHRLVDLDGNRAIFETTVSRQPEISNGDMVVFRSWWSADQLAVARDVDRPWRRAEFTPTDSITYRPDGSSEVTPSGWWDHEHCRLCWKTIGEDVIHGYVDGDNWLCENCYQEYIANGFGRQLGDEV